MLALSRQGRGFVRLSVPHFAALGAGAGLLLYGVLALNAWARWSVEDAIANAMIFVFLGSGSATASLLFARKAAPALESLDELQQLREGRRG